MHSIASRRLRPQVPFTSRSTQLGLAPSFAANHPRELPKPPEAAPGFAPHLLTLAMRLLFIVLVVLTLLVGLFLFGQQWRSGADAGPEEHEAAAPLRPYEWGTETDSE